MGVNVDQSSISMCLVNGLSVRRRQDFHAMIAARQQDTADGIDYHMQINADALCRIARCSCEEDACAMSGIETSPLGLSPKL
jgi:hypothetical protein